ncbi:MAG: outer membrane protein assembly factor [Chitinophagales bacterium]
MSRRLSVSGFVVVALLLGVLSVAGIAATGAGAAQAANPIVKAIAVEGNREIPAGTITGVIKATRVGEPATEEAIRKDLQEIMDLGYFFNVSAKFAPVDGGVKVVFEVVENPKLKDVIFSGAPDLPPDKLKASLGLQDGQIINGKQLQDSLKGLLDKTVKDYGIPVRIADVAVDEQGVVKVKLAEARVGQIDIAGNEKTKEYVIRRELTLKPGDVLNLKELEKSLRRVLNLGFFDEVGRKFTETKDPDVVNVTIEVKERKTGSAAFGAGYSSSDGLLGYVEYAEDNFFGRGQRINVKWEFGQKKNTYDVGFYEPHLDANRTSLDVRAYNTRTTRDSNSSTYEDTTVGGQVTVGRPLSEDTRVYAKLTLEDVASHDSDGNLETSGKNHSITASVVNDTRDFFLKPTKGGRRELSVEWAGELLGSDYTFAKYTTDLSQYFPAGANGQVWALRLGAGYLDYTGQQPVLERFLIGGADTVRGYENNAFSGDKYLLANAEYRFDVSKGLTGVAFVDAGKAWEASDQADLGQLKVGYGLGLRVDTPLGVMRIDYGVPTDHSQGGRTYFSLGQTF